LLQRRLEARTLGVASQQRMHQQPAPVSLDGRQVK
jgi:hypothetical protein